MVLACARWRTIGKRYTSPSEVVDVALQAATTTGPSSEGGIQRVEFYLSFNGGAPITLTTTTMEVCEPAHSEFASLIPGATPGRLAPFPGYKVSLALNSLGQTHGFGTITITARVFSVAGTATDLDIPVYIHNDTDGGDRRPTQKNLFVDPINGNDLNSGTSSGSAYRSLQRAFQGEMGGAFITLMPGLLSTGAPSGTTPWQCSGGHWVTIQGQPGSLLRRDVTTGAGFMYTGGLGGACRMRFVGVTFVDAGPTFLNPPSDITEAWLDGCLHYHSSWSPAKPWTLRAFDNDGPTVFFTAMGPQTRTHATNCLWLGMVNGPDVFYLLHDCVVTDFQAIAVNLQDRASLCNVIIQRQRAMRDVAGRVYGPVAGCTVSVPASGQMRIDATGPLFYGPEGASLPMDIATLGEIAGHPVFRVECLGFANANNNGGFFPVLSSGINGSGWPFVVLSNPSAIAGAAGASAFMRTTSLQASPPYDLAHPDIIYLQGGPSFPHTNTMLYGVVARDIDFAQSFFNSDTNHTRLCMWNCRDGGNRPQSANMGGGNKIDSLFLQNTIAGIWPIGGVQTGTQMRNNVVGSAAGWTAGVMDSNHFITGPTFGTSASTGTWFATDPTLSPWSHQPTGGNLNTGSALVPEIVSRRWPGATGPTRGCYADAGLFDWSTGAAPRGITALFTHVRPVVLTATGVTGLVAFFNATRLATLSATGTVGAPSPGGGGGGGSPPGTSIPPEVFSVAVAVTPSDSVLLPQLTNAVYSSGGNVSVRLENGSDVVFRNLPAGLLPRLRVARVNATGTTASNIVALF